MPFLASPMGKGVMDDNHPLSVGAARSHALQEADVIVLMGARLNWIMHFGLPPRFNKNVRIVQLDISPEAISQNVPAEVALVGDGKAIVGQMNRALESIEWFYPQDTDWHKAIAEKSAANAKQIQPMIDDESAPTNYYRAFRDISPWIPKNAIIIGEGANTMDIGRTQMPNNSARTRLDAGSYGTMGVGMGFVLAAAAVHPDRPIVSVSGDSAIGFSGMEMETVCRHKMPVKIVVLNNGGIGSGVAAAPRRPAERGTGPSDGRRALRQDDGSVRRQGLLRHRSQGPESGAGRGDEVQWTGTGERAAAPRRRPQAAAVHLAHEYGVTRFLSGHGSK